MSIECYLVQVPTIETQYSKRQKLMTIYKLPQVLSHQNLVELFVLYVENNCINKPGHYLLARDLTLNCITMIQKKIYSCNKLMLGIKSFINMMKNIQIILCKTQKFFADWIVSTYVVVLRRVNTKSILVMYRYHGYLGVIIVTSAKPRYYTKLTEKTRSGFYLLSRRA